MKKLVLALLVVIGFTAQAQNYVGYSKKEVQDALDNHGEHYSEGNANNGVPYIATENRIEATYKVYYFDAYNQCLRYVIFYKNASYQAITQFLNKEYKKFNGKWYDTGTEISVDYDNELKGYLVRFDKYEL